MTELIPVYNHKGKIIDELECDKDLCNSVTTMLKNYIPITSIATHDIPSKKQHQILIIIQNKQALNTLYNGLKKSYHVRKIGAGISYYYSECWERQSVIAKLETLAEDLTTDKHCHFEAFYPSRAEVQKSIDFMKWAGEETDEDLDNPEYNTVEWYNRIRRLNKLAEKYGDMFDN